MGLFIYCVNVHGGELTGGTRREEGKRKRERYIKGKSHWEIGRDFRVWDKISTSGQKSLNGFTEDGVIVRSFAHHVLVTKTQEPIDPPLIHTSFLLIIYMGHIVEEDSQRTLVEVHDCQGGRAEGECTSAFFQPFEFSAEPKSNFILRSMTGVQAGLCEYC